MLYHVIGRVMDRHFVLGTDQKEKFWTLIRMQENSTCCRALFYGLTANHFHILLEVPPMAEVGFRLRRLSAIWGETLGAVVAQELAEARAGDYTNESGMDEAVVAIHRRFTCRMQDLADFMQGCCKVLPSVSIVCIHARGRCGRIGSRV